MATKAVDLLYWRSLPQTGVVFTGLVVVLASMFQLSTITVLSHLLLALMGLTTALRLYYKLLELLRWNPGLHPFQSQLDEDGTLTDEATVAVVEGAVLRIAFALTELKRLVFIGSVVDSIKFAVFLYLLTHVGVATSGLTLVMACVITAFSVPLLYRKQQVRIRRLSRSLRTTTKRIKTMFMSMYRKVIPASAAASDHAPTPPPTPASPAPKQKAKAK
ncbi:reticulon-2b [Gadus chalcogrammus]|uniref:reticulon-2b n=1 Tax=Gadus chalcogrammus TaxID=1042646 RepID=UPI0024C4AB4B|nr:reticulon-2b [Gadus chalcogrammus]